jgi:WD40 repeat protein
MAGDSGTFFTRVRINTNYVRNHQECDIVRSKGDSLWGIEVVVCPDIVMPSSRETLMNRCNPQKLLLTFFVIGTFQSSIYGEVNYISRDMKPNWEADLGHRGTAIARASSGEILAGDILGRVHVLDPASGESLKRLIPHVEFVGDLSASTKGAVVVSVSTDGSLVVMDARKRLITRTFAGIGESPRHRVALSGDGTLATVCFLGANPTIATFDILTGKRLRLASYGDYSNDPMEALLQNLQELTIDETGKRAAVGLTRSLVFYDFEKSEVVDVIKPRNGFLFATTSDTTLRSSFLWHDRLEVRDNTNKSIVAAIESPLEKLPGVDLRRCQPGLASGRFDKKTVAVCLNDHVQAPSYLFVWQYGKQPSAVVFKAHQGMMTGCILSDDARYLYSIGGADGLVKKWAIADFVERENK